MPKTAAKFRQADVARAIRAVEQTGAAMEVVLERDGRIRLTRATGAPMTFHDPRAEVAEDAIDIEL